MTSYIEAIVSNVEPLWYIGCAIICFSCAVTAAVKVAHSDDTTAAFSIVAVIVSTACTAYFVFNIITI